MLVPAGPAFTMERLESPHFVFLYEEGRLPMARELSHVAETVLRQVSATLGIKAGEQKQITVQIHHGAAAFNKALRQKGARVEWAAGIAIPSKREIVLRIDAQTRFHIHDIFRHEVSHVVLYRAVGGRHIPRWFNEGIAVHQAGERILERWQRTANASLSDGLIPFSALENGFPANGLRADLAYAQSTAFVDFLIHLHGWGAIRVLLRRVSEGVAFQDAVRSVYGRALMVLEREWRLQVERRASWIPFLTGTGILWLVISALFVLSWAVNRKRMLKRLEAMDDQPLEDELVLLESAVDEVRGGS
jgi:hypothetical protein